MIPVVQTAFGDPVGNCFAACMASILEVPLDRVPDFKGNEVVVGGRRFWLDQWRGWLAPANLTITYLPDVVGPAGYAIVSIHLPRNAEWSHAVVCLNGGAVWDPYPGADPLAANDAMVRRHFYAIGVLDPARAVDLRRLPLPDESGWPTNAWGMPQEPDGER